MRTSFPLSLLLLLVLSASSIQAGVGDPQIRTDHPWYPGELACSTFERLFATQADLYQRVAGVKPVTEEQKALAAWLWRNTHYWHGEEGPENLWGKGFKTGELRTRDYWTGLFAHGFGLCGAVDNQFIAEMEALLGHSRGRSVGVEDHNSFEVFLTGGLYGKGKWVLLDPDLSVVIFDREGKAMLGLAEIQKDWQRLTSRTFLPERQPWLVCGLHPNDGACYRRYDVAEYLAGYSGPPPMVHLRRGETLRRYLEPGLEDGKTFVFWGRNYNTNGIPGPERARTWVNQPERMYKSKEGSGWKPGQAHFANAVYVYKPNFADGTYKEGVIEENDAHVVFKFYTPYIIAATPPNKKDWGIFDIGCRNGLVLRGKSDCAVSLSLDQGKTWQECGKLNGALDLTDLAKGYRQYFLRLHAGAQKLREAGLIVTTVCQASAAVMPRLKDQGSTVTSQSTGRAVVSAGPNLPQAQAHIVDGKFGSPRVTLEVTSPRGEPITAIYPAAHVMSSNPPSPDIKYHIDFSLDGGKNWVSMVKDWTIPRRGDEPGDFWSQSFCWGRAGAENAWNRADITRVQVRFHNTGGKNYARAEVHVAYAVPGKDATRVTFSWSDDKGPQRASHTFAGYDKEPTWTVPTGQGTKTHWVEMEAVAGTR